MALIKHKSASVSNVRRDSGRQDREKSEKKDQRVVRTRQQLDAAFVALLHRRAYGNIRVSDIIRKAGVGRATFYAHYSSKDDLLWSQFDRIVLPMLVIKRGDACPLDATALFAHLQAAPQIYRGLIAGPEAGGGPRIMQQCFEARIREAIKLGFGVEETMITRFVASSLLVVSESSVENSERLPPQEVQAIFARLVGGALAAAKAAHPKA